MPARLLRLPMLAATALLWSCSPAPPPASSAASPTVQSAHAKTAAALDIDDPESFAAAGQGFIAKPSGQVHSASGELLWDFDSFQFQSGKAPDSVNPSLWRQALLNNHVGLFQVHERIWQLRGFDLANMTLIQGDSGWIVVDPLTSRETAAVAIAFAREHLGEHPVSAIIYTHSHADHFGGVLGVISAEQARAEAIPILAPAGFLEEATSENVLVGTAMARRAGYMYGKSLPRNAQGLIDNGLGKAVAFGSIGLIPPTQVITQPHQEVILDGLQFVFHNVPGSEAPAEFTFNLPQLGAYCGAELMSHTLHNLYTLRGAKVRDALQWARFLDQALEHISDVDVVFNQHHWPVWGEQQARQFITAQRDVYRYIHDQTVRHINAGLTSAEIAEQLQLPPTLSQHMSTRGYYGSVRHNVKAVYQFYMGWYDGNPANLDPLPPIAAAERYVALAGGALAILDQAQAALDVGDFRWAAELLKHAVYADPGNQQARELQAQAFDQLGYLAESAAWRNVYLSGALELRAGGPDEGFARSRLVEMLAHAPIERFLDAMAATLDGVAAADSDLRINLQFSDRNEAYALWIENAVLHHRRVDSLPPADATLTLTHRFFLRMITGEAGAASLLTSSETQINGSTLSLASFFGMLDKAPGTFGLIEP